MAVCANAVAGIPHPNARAQCKFPPAYDVGNSIGSPCSALRGMSTGILPALAIVIFYATFSAFDTGVEITPDVKGSGDDLSTLSSSQIGVQAGGLL